MYSGSSGGGYYESRSSSYRDSYERQRSSTSGYGSSSGREHRYSTSGRSSHRHSSPSSSTRIRESSRYHRSPSPGPSRSRHEMRESRRDSPPSHQDRHRDKERHSSNSKKRSQDSEERSRHAADDNRNVLERMEKSFSDGPLEVLKRCMKNKTKVKVWTRNYKEVRGICTGFILAFDKHWNIIMRDVDEIHLKPLKAKTPFLRELKVGDSDLIPEMEPKVPKEKKKKDSEKAKNVEVPVAAAADSSQDIEEVPVEKVSVQEETSEVSVPQKNESTAEKHEKKREKRRKRKAPLMCKRHVGQIFIRGDNVVMAAIVSGVTPSSPLPQEETSDVEEDPEE